MTNLNKYINLLEKLTNKKVKLIEDKNNNILIPRRSPEERQKNYLIATNKKIQEYIKNGSKGDLDLSESPIEKLPDNLIEVNGYLDLTGCINLKELPNNLKVETSLYLTNTSIETLPDNLVKINGDLDLDNCKNLKSLNNLKYINGYLYLSNCINLKELPNNLKVKDSLYLSNTPIKELSSGLKVGRNLELTNTLIEKLPDDLRVKNVIFLKNTPLAKNKELLNQYRKKFKIII
jgi:hypothetical protein